MSSVLLKSLGFSPRRSNHYASWVPIFLEPLVGSGERICIGVAAADSERAIVFPVPGLERLTCVYGREVDAFLTASSLALEAAERHVKKHGIESLVEWKGPMEGVVVGPVRAGAGENLEDVAHTGLMQCASLVRQAAESSEDADVAEKSGAGLGRLDVLVKDSVIIRRPDLAHCFGHSFQVSENARPTRVGFAGTKLVANFGLLIPGRLSPSVDKAKVKLWDLQQLKSGALSGLLPKDNVLDFELLLYRARPDDPHYTDRQIAALNAAALDLEEAADKVDVRCRPMYSTADIANFVIEKEAA